MGLRSRHTLCRHRRVILCRHHESDVDRHPKDPGRRKRRPLANLLVTPQDGGDGTEDTDPLYDLKQDIRNAAGAGLMVETVNAGWGEGKASAPQGDWTPRRYGPMPPESLVGLSEQAHGMMLAASGLPPDLATVSTAQGQREAFRRYLTMTVMPLSNMLVRELQEKLETDVSLSFSALYAHDLIGRRLR